MKFKVLIKSTPVFSTILTARTIAEARRMAIREAVLLNIRMLYSDEIEIERLKEGSNIVRA